MKNNLCLVYALANADFQDWPMLVLVLMQIYTHTGQIENCRRWSGVKW